MSDTQSSVVFPFDRLQTSSLSKASSTAVTLYSICKQQQLYPIARPHITPSQQPAAAAAAEASASSAGWKILVYLMDTITEGSTIRLIFSPLDGQSLSQDTCASLPVLHLPVSPFVRLSVCSPIRPVTVHPSFVRMSCSAARQNPPVPFYAEPYAFICLSVRTSVPPSLCLYVLLFVRPSV